MNNGYSKLIRNCNVHLSASCNKVTQIPNGPFTLGGTLGRQEPHHPSGQQLRALKDGHPVIDEVAIHSQMRLTQWIAVRAKVRLDL